MLPQLPRSTLLSAFEESAAGQPPVLTGPSFCDILERLGVHLSKKEQMELLKQADSDHDGVLTFEEFQLLFTTARLRHVFDSIDESADGWIEASELKAALGSLDVHLTESEVKKLLLSVDRNNDGRVDFDEFATFFSKVENPTLHSIGMAWTKMNCDIGSDLAPPLPTPDKPLLEFMMAGGIGGCCSRTVTAPLEKVKIQAQVGGIKGGQWLESLVSTARQHGWRSLFAGNGANLVRVFPLGGLTCVFYSKLTKLAPVDSELDPGEPFWRAICGGLAGGMAATITYPLDTIRAQLTVHGVPKQHSVGIVEAYRSLAKQGRLYRGLSPTLAACVPFVAIQQASYDTVKMAALSSGLTPSVPLFLGCGCIAGAIAQGVVYPLDVIRRRVQLNAVPSSGTATTMHTWTAMRSIVAKEGIRSMFAGLTPTFIKVLPAVSVSLIVRDSLLGRLT